MKTLIGMVIGIACVCGAGYTYNLPHGLHDDTKLVVDVRLVEIGGHEYVVSCMASGNLNGGCGISTLHHVGCKACSK